MDIHFAKGALFENLVINEVQKNILNAGRQPKLYFWRDYSQREIDLLIQDGINIKAVEIKSGKTIQSDFFNGLSYFQKIAPHSSLHLVYGGAEFQARTAAKAYPIGDLSKL